MNKIKAFFENKVTKIVEGAVICMASAGLIIGGVSVEQIQTMPVVTLGVITAIEGVITVIQGLTTKKA